MSVKLDISREELYAYQAIHHFITKRGYQAVKVQNRNEDVWLVHPMEYAYPVICVSTLYQGSKIEQIRIHNVFKMLARRLHKGARLLLLTTNSNALTSENFDCVYMGADYISDEHVQHQFPLLAKSMKDVSQPLEVVAQLSLAIEEVQLHRMDRFKRLMKQKRYPYITLLLMLICTMIFSIYQGLCSYSNESSLWMVVLGGGTAPLIHHACEYIRLFTATFLHGSILSFLLNMWIAYSIGKRMEMLYGSKNYLILWFLVLLSGNIVCYSFASNEVFYGIQYGLWGLYGTYLWSIVVHNLLEHKHVRSYFVRITLMMLCTFFFAQANIIAMIASLVMGMLFAFYKQSDKKLYPLFCIGSVACMLVVSMFIFPQPTMDIDLKQQMIEIYDETIFDGYANYLQKQLMD